jgi:hypothetical protein
MHSCEEVYFLEALLIAQHGVLYAARGSPPLDGLLSLSRRSTPGQLEPV